MIYLDIHPMDHYLSDISVPSDCLLLTKLQVLYIAGLKLMILLLHLLSVDITGLCHHTRGLRFL